MEMEYLNDNTLRVFIGADDLAARGISLMDIIGDRQQVEQFFMSVLEEADVSKKFQHTDAVTFQVMPKQGGIDLYISKSAEGGKQDSSDLTDSLLDYMADQEEDVDENESVGLASSDLNLDSVDPAYHKGQIVIEFENFDDFLNFARYFKSAEADAEADLYEYKGRYYTIVSFQSDTISDYDMQDYIYTFMEYGRLTPVRIAMLREHGKLLMARNAASRTRQLFDLN